MFKRFSVALFSVTIVIYLILAFYTYFINFAIDEGNKVSKIEQMIAPIFIIIRYPAWLFLPIMRNFQEFIFGICLNCLFYGLLVERLSYFMFRKHRMTKASAINGTEG
jgi:hypothetical protein